MVALRALRSSPPGTAAGCRVAAGGFWLPLEAGVKSLALVAGEQGSTREPSESCRLGSQKAKRKAWLRIPF